jgi:phosphate transport system protein
MLERHLDEDLTRLNENLLKMAALVEKAIYNSVEAFKNRDKEMAEEVVKNDNKIDELENIIEESAIEILALKQPMAVDLRFITTGMKINAELERIADLAVNISQRVLEIVDEPELKPLVDIPKLSAVAQQMVKGAIDAFVNRDEAKAKKVILSDPEANMMKNLIHEEIMRDYLAKDGTTASRAIPLILVARHLERICDHATNIAEDVIYMIQARVVRHNKL